MASITLNFKNKVNNYKTNFNAVNVIEIETSFINLKDYLKEGLELDTIERHSLKTFSEMLGVKENNVWGLFNGRQKKFKKRYIVIN